MTDKPPTPRQRGTWPEAVDVIGYSEPQGQGHDQFGSGYLTTGDEKDRVEIAAFMEHEERGISLSELAGEKV